MFDSTSMLTSLYKRDGIFRLWMPGWLRHRPWWTRMRR